MLRMRGSAAARTARTARTPGPRIAAAFVLALALTTAGTLVSTAQATPQSQLSAEQQQAAQLQSQIEANGNQVSVLDEQYLQAQQAIQQATDQLNADQAQVDAKQRETARVRSLLETRAAALYMGAGNTAPLAAMDVTSTQQLGSRTAYGAAAADQDRQLLDTAKVAIEQLGVEQKALAGARKRALAERDQLDAARKQIADATAQQEALLAQVKGKIKTLVDQIQAEKDREAAAAARAAMERQAQERAAQAAAARQRQSSSSGSSSSGSSSGGGGSTSSGPPVDLPSPSGNASIAVSTAEAQLGKPYVYAASGPDSFDCSGLTMYAWAAAGVAMPHNAEMQYNSFPHVPMDQLQPGDLVFYGSPIHHVGMFVGNGTMIEAPYTGVDVRYHTIYRPDFAGAARP
jgi:cell wall-associated NlpC family hydrolase